MGGVDHAEALEAAADALSVWAQRLGTHGLAFDTAARAAGQAAAEVTAAALEHRSDVELVELIGAHEQAMATVVARLDELQNAERTMRAQLDDTRRIIDQVTAEREQAVVRALAAEGALKRVVAVPYVGEEPPQRRVAREALDR